jgi:hypothetical protein
VGEAVLGGTPRFVWGGIATAVVTAAFAIGASPASATTDRADYAAQVNPICASTNAQIKQLIETFEQELRRLDRKANKARGKKRDKLEARIEQLFTQLPGESLAISYAELAQLRSVNAAPGDDGLVSTWLANRQKILDLSAQANRIQKRADRLINRTFKVHSFRAFTRLTRRVNALQRKAYQVYEQIEPLADKDVELGTQLGATYCVTEATVLP